MSLEETFKTYCRSLRFGNTASSLSFRNLNTGKNREIHDGTVAVFSFAAFKAELIYAISGPYAVAGGTLWLRFVFSQEPDLLLTVYDMLHELEPTEFHSYTYTEVDSPEVIKICFDALRPFLSRLLPQIDELSRDPSRRNALLDRRRNDISAYYGDDTFKNSANIGGTVEKIRNRMMAAMETFELNRVLCGSLGLLCEGKREKALKNLGRSKWRSGYDEALLEFLKSDESVGFCASTVNIDEAEQKKLKKSAARKVRTDFFMAFVPAVLLSVPVSLLLILISFVLTHVLFSDAEITVRNIWGLVLAALPSLFVGLSLSYILQKPLAKYLKSKGRTVNEPRGGFDRGKKVFGAMLIISECAAAVCCVAAANSAVNVYKSGIGYSESDFSIKQTSVSFEEIDSIWETKGYNSAFGFESDRSFVVKLKSGKKIDLYNGAGGTGFERFKAEALPYITARGIESGTANTVEDIP